MGFTLKVINPPVEAAFWIGNFAENTFNYDPPADSGALAIDATWEYPGDPLGCTTLHIRLFDVDHNIIYEILNLGPIYDGVDYIFDCSISGVVTPPSIFDYMMPMIMMVMMIGLVMPMLTE